MPVTKQVLQTEKLTESQITSDGIVQYLCQASQLDLVQEVSIPTHSSIDSVFMMDFYPCSFFKGFISDEMKK